VAKGSLRIVSVVQLCTCVACSSPHIRRLPLGDPLGPQVRVIMSGQAKLKMEDIIT